MTDCKHDWHFIEGSERLRCERCKAETGPKTYEQRVQDFLQEPWTTEQLTVPVGQLQIADFKPNYNISFHNNRDTGGFGTMVGKLDFNGPELVFTGDAAESAKVFIDWIARAFHGRLEQERAEEREACAKVCEAYTDNDGGKFIDHEGHGYECAAAIRARGKRS